MMKTTCHDHTYHNEDSDGGGDDDDDTKDDAKDKESHPQQEAKEELAHNSDGTRVDWAQREEEERKAPRDGQVVVVKLADGDGKMAF